VPRTRSARVAVLGSVERRSASASAPSRSHAALRRRIVVVGLVLLSLVLVTVYFRESSNGGFLHSFQSTGASVLKPFEVAAERVARPFQDVAGWFDDVLGAKAENTRLKAENDVLRGQAIENQMRAREAAELERILRFKNSPQFPKDYRAVTTRVLAPNTGPFEQEVLVGAGSRDGVRLHDPVVTGVDGFRGVRGGLVGQVTKVTRDVAKVTLLVDATSYVSVHDSRTGADGIVQRGEGTSGSLKVENVTKDKVVTPGDAMVTAGWQSKDFASIYPRGIPVCIVTYVNQQDIDLYKSIQCKSFVDFGSLEAVVVLVAKKPHPVLPR
jgi:rod shape-determining protein MreC